MTDAAPRTRFIPCAPDPDRPDPSSRREYCGGLVLDTDDMRRQHREWHAHEAKVKEAFRDALRDANVAIRARDITIADLGTRIDDMARDVKNIDIPDPIDPIEITIGGWSDDDEPDPEDDLDELMPADEDDLDDEPAVTPGIGSSLYTPGPGPIA